MTNIKLLTTLTVQVKLKNRLLTTEDEVLRTDISIVSERERQLWIRKDVSVNETNSHIRAERNARKPSERFTE